MNKDKLLVMPLGGLEQLVKAVRNDSSERIGANCTLI